MWEGLKILSTILPSTGQNKFYGNNLLYVTSVFTVKMANHYGNHREECSHSVFCPVDGRVVPRVYV